MFQTVTSILARSENISHPYLKRGASDRKAVVVITSNRGLAGGYNSNVTKLVKAAGFSPEETDIYAIGNKGREYFRHRGYTIKKEYSYVMESPTFADANEVCKEVLRSFVEGEIGEIYLAYTHFKNTVVHVPTMLKLLPVEFNPEDLKSVDDKVLMNFEPNEEEALNLIIPKYVTSLFYGALIEAVASENGARMQAMDSATSNAEDMIDALSLKYNRARQGSITQELTEIIAGSQAITQ